jgi:LPS-assembly protein
VRSELVHFRRDETVTGERIDLQPTVQWPFIGRVGYFTPSFKLWHTRYRLSDAGPDISDSQSRTLPLMSVDAGAYFERTGGLGYGSYLQTLEPRLYYLYVPGRDQQDIPVFDSAQRDLSFGLLFRDNRFSGADRVGDANQVSLGLVSRLLDRETGRERLRAGIGQIRYFANLNVTLPGEPVDSRSASDILGELAARFTEHWSGYFTVQWDQYDNTAARSGLQLHYERDRGRMLNLAYRRIDPDVEQTDISLLWPINPDWSVVGRWNYSLKDSRTLETVFGLGYNSCCWSLRLAGRRYITETDGKLRNNSAVFIEAELKGLTRVGSHIEDLLERGIFGDEF